MVEFAPTSETKKMSKRDWADWILLRLLLIGGFAAMGLIIWRIFRDDAGFNYIPSSSDGTLLVQANDRLLEVVQWALGLVITVGGLLVGYSWFQNRSNRKEDQERFERAVNEAEASYKRNAELVSEIQTLVANHDREIANIRNGEISKIAGVERRLGLLEFSTQMSFYRAASPRAVVSTVGAIEGRAGNNDLDGVVAVADYYLRKWANESTGLDSSALETVIRVAIITTKMLHAAGANTLSSVPDLNDMASDARSMTSRNLISESAKSLLGEWADLLGVLVATSM